MHLVEETIYLSSNRRSSEPVVERLIELEEQELTVLEASAAGLRVSCAERLLAAGVIARPEEFPQGPVSGDPRDLLCHAYCHTALLLQSSAGHRVNVAAWIRDPSDRRCRVIYQYEERSVGIRAGDLALAAILESVPRLRWQGEEPGRPGSLPPLTDRIGEFVSYARGLSLPGDTRAILAAASESGVPCLKLDRYPFEPAVGDFRIRSNAALQLGHCRHQQVVDGTFCVSRSSRYAPLLNDRRQVNRLFRHLGLEVPPGNEQPNLCSTFTRAVRTARRAGYPLWVKPVMRQPDAPEPVLAAGEAELEAALNLPGFKGKELMLEAHVPGDCYRLLFANRRLVGVLQAKSAGMYAPVASEALPKALLDGALAVAGTVDVGMMTITGVAGESHSASAARPAVFVNLDLAPRLDTFLPQDSPLHAEASREFVRWLFPTGTNARVPIAAVTGTNGKTTTSRMLFAMLRQSGLSPGLACTDGVYGSDNRLIREGDSSGGAAHCLLLSNPDLDSLVLETARGGVARGGILFDRCDVGICTNVTADHLGMRGLETLEQMAALKRSIMARASRAVVLNADSTECLAMLPFREAETTCLVSMRRTAEELREMGRAHGSCAVLEEVAGREWMVIHGPGGRMPLIEVNEAPSTFGGTARHNVANALHASLAACLLGVAIEEIRAVLADFRMNFEETPGRLNICDDLPFRVIMDYAHNADGFRQLCRFTDFQAVAGRRIVVFTLFGDRRDSDIIDAAAEMAGHFDHYICRNYRDLRGGRDPEEIPALLRKALLGANVPAEAIETVPDPVAAIEAGLSMAGEGDLLVLLTDREEFRPTWDRVVSRSHAPA